jgi:apolipoprotein N-acyltransferase
MFNLNASLAFTLSIAGGVIYCFGFPLTFAPAIFFGPILGMVAVFYCWSATDDENQQRMGRSRTLKVELMAWLGFSMVCSLFGHYWIAATLKEFGNIPIPINFLLAALFSLVIMPHYLLFILLWRAIPDQYNPLQKLHHPGMKSFFLAMLLTTLENFTPKQFPAHMGHAWLNLAPKLGLAPIFGVPIYSFVSFWMALAIVMLIKRKFVDYGAIVAMASVVTLSILYPLVPHPKHYGEKLSTVNIRMMQPNIGNHIKLSLERGRREAIEQTYALYDQLSSAPSLIGDLDLIIWPETAFPALASTERLRNGTLPPHPLLQSIAAKSKASLLIGGYDSNPKGDGIDFHSQYNAALFFLNRGGKSAAPLSFSEVYHKRILIPFGERLPLGPLSKYVRPHIENISYFAVGKRFPLFKLNSGHQFTMAICYEVLFYDFIRNYLNSVKQSPDFIVNLTNDSWYGRTSEPYQHLFLSKWRALEFQMPLIRMTNTGISSIIYPDGSESERTPLFTATNLDVPLKLGPPGSSRPTLFQQWGFLMMLPLWAGIFVLLLLLTRYQRRF